MAEPTTTTTFAFAATGVGLATWYPDSMATPSSVRSPGQHWLRCMRAMCR
jgi:hypothetical protein